MEKLIKTYIEFICNPLITIPTCFVLIMIYYYIKSNNLQ